MRYTSKTIDFEVPTVNDFPVDGLKDGQTIIVTEEGRGGIFVYDSTKVDEHNDGTNFHGWLRQYDGEVKISWFNISNDTVENASILINILKSFDNIEINKSFTTDTIYAYQLSNKTITSSKEFKILSDKDSVFVFTECTNIEINNLNIDQSITQKPDTAASLYSKGTILCSGCDLMFITNCYIITSYSAAICLINTTRSIVDSNTIPESLNDLDLTDNLYSSHGVYLVDSSENNKIINNTIKNQGYGISLQNLIDNDGTNNNIISNNIIKNCFVYGIMLYNQNLSGLGQIKNNIIKSNNIDTVYGNVINYATGNLDFGAGIYLLNTEYTNVGNNEIRNTNLYTVGQTLNPAAIGCSMSKYTTISNNTIQDFNFFAINLYNTDSANASINITGNSISNSISTVNIHTNASGINITGNSFSCSADAPNYGWAVQGVEKYQGVVYDGLVFSNNIIDNMNIINLTRHENFVIDGNYCNTTTDGIKIEDLAYGVISNNIIGNTTVTSLVINAPNTGDNGTICNGNYFVTNLTGYIQLYSKCSLDAYANYVYYFRILGDYIPIATVGDTNSINATNTNVFAFDTTSTTAIDMIIFDDAPNTKSFKEIKLCTSSISRTIKNTGTGIGGISLKDNVDVDIPDHSTLILEFNPSGSFWKELSRNF